MHTCEDRGARWGPPRVTRMYTLRLYTLKKTERELEGHAEPSDMITLVRTVSCTKCMCGCATTLDGRVLYSRCSSNI